MRPVKYGINICFVFVFLVTIFIKTEGYIFKSGTCSSVPTVENFDLNQVRFFSLQ